MGPQAKRGRLAVPAFYSTIGLLLAIALQSTCNFVHRRLVLSYTKRPTAVPTPTPSMSPSAAPTVFVIPPNPMPTVNGTGNGTAPGGGGGGGGNSSILTNLIRTEGGGGESGGDVGNSNNNNRRRRRRLQASTSAPAPQPAPVTDANDNSTDSNSTDANTNTTLQPTPLPDPIKELEESQEHKVGLWDWEVSDGICVPYTVCLETRACVSPKFDSKFNAARTFAVLSSLVGGVATFILLASLCFPHNPAYLTPVYVVLIMFQGISLLVYRSETCNRLGDVSFWLGAGGPGFDSDTGELTDEAKQYEAYLTDNTQVICTHGAGSRMAVSALIMWFLAAITCFWNVKRTRDI